MHVTYFRIFIKHEIHCVSYSLRFYYLLKVKKRGTWGRCEMLLLPYILVSTVSKVFTVNNDIRKALTNGYKVMTGCIKIVTFGNMNDV